LVLVDSRGVAQMREFAKRIAAKRRTETAIDAVDELRPRRNALVLLEAIVPLACSALEIERCRRDLEMVRRAIGTEELLPFVQPCNRVVGAVELGEAQLVDRRRRRSRRRGGVGVEAALPIQNLSLDVLDGRREEAELLPKVHHVGVQFLAVVTDELYEFVNHLVEDRLGDGSVVVVGHGGDAMRVSGAEGKVGLWWAAECRSGQEGSLD